MIRLKILYLCLSAFFFNTASAYVLLNCVLTEDGQINFKSSIQSKYGCSLSADHTYVLHGAGEDFSSAWNDAVKACSNVYASEDECNAMIASCTVAMEGSYESPNVTGTCECLGPIQNQSVCGKIDGYTEAHVNFNAFIGYYGKGTCKVKFENGKWIKSSKAFPINCNFKIE